MPAAIAEQASASAGVRIVRHSTGGRGVAAGAVVLVEVPFLARLPEAEEDRRHDQREDAAADVGHGIKDDVDMPGQAWIVAKVYWKPANEPPATSRAGQTSQVCLHEHMHLTMYSGIKSDKSGS